MPQKQYLSPIAAHDLIRPLLPERWAKVTIMKRAINPAQLTSDLSEMSRLQNPRHIERCFHCLFENTNRWLLCCKICILRTGHFPDFGLVGLFG